MRMTSCIWNFHNKSQLLSEILLTSMDFFAQFSLIPFCTIISVRAFRAKCALACDTNRTLAFTLHLSGAYHKFYTALCRRQYWKLLKGYTWKDVKYPFLLLLGKALYYIARWRITTRSLHREKSWVFFISLLFQTKGFDIISVRKFATC